MTAIAMMGALVECYAGSRYPERPRAFLLEGEWLEVAEVEREWRTPSGLAFWVRSRDGRHFTLVYDDVRDAWEMWPQMQ